MTSPYILHTLHKGLAVLEALAAAEEDLTLTELARRLKESRTGVFRPLRTLQERGYVQQDAVLPRVARLGSRLQGRSADRAGGGRPSSSGWPRSPGRHPSSRCSARATCSTWTSCTARRPSGCAWS